MWAAIYRGEFLGLGGVVWRVEIGHEVPQGTQVSSTELTFPADGPLVIEWGETDKIEPLQSSSATLRVICGSDREFVHLYTTEPLSYRMDVYMSDALYWSGTLDTELYEEPYSTLDGYVVSLTFSDLAVLDRFSWPYTGRASMREIISSCLSMCALGHLPVEKMISTTENWRTGSNPWPVIDLDDIILRNDNFIDEDGEAKSARDVLAAVLQPFALRIVQKGGRFHLYDLNALHGMEDSPVSWCADDSVLSVDKVYNNVRVTFSPYAEAELMKGTVESTNDPSKLTGTHQINLDYRGWDGFETSRSQAGFLFGHGPALDSNMVIGNGARFFQITSVNSGSDATGVVYSLKPALGPVSYNGSSRYSDSLNAPFSPVTFGENVSLNVDSRLKTIIACPRVFINESTMGEDLRLRINLDLLFDVRYNPFEEPGDYNDNATYKINGVKHDGPYQNMQDWCNYGYVPIKLNLLDENGDPVMHMVNRYALQSGGINLPEGEWEPGSASWGDAWLCYYDFDDRKSKSGFGGWRSNRQIIGYTRDALPRSWKTQKDGEYIPLPGISGYLELEIGSGVLQFDYQREIKDIYPFVRYILYREPTITICDKYRKDLEPEDIEDSAWLDRHARESLEIETIIGTPHGEACVPNARGFMYDAQDRLRTTFRRGSAYGRLEELLIGTVYSQYAGRKFVLSGTARLLPSFCPLCDQNTEGKFILLGETQDCRMFTSEIRMAVFEADSYHATESD